MKPSSGSHNQYLAKIPALVECGYRQIKPVILAKYWLWLTDDGFLVNRNMLEKLS
jgi:hypothetical protein